MKVNENETNHLRLKAEDKTKEIFTQFRLLLVTDINMQKLLLSLICNAMGHGMYAIGSVYYRVDCIIAINGTKK